MLQNSINVIMMLVVLGLLVAILGGRFGKKSHTDTKDEQRPRDGDGTKYYGAGNSDTGGEGGSE